MELYWFSTWTSLHSDERWKLEYHGFSTTFELFELVKLSSLHWLSGVAYGDDERKYERVKSCVR